MLQQLFMLNSVNRLSAFDAHFLPICALFHALKSHLSSFAYFFTFFFSTPTTFFVGGGRSSSPPTHPLVTTALHSPFVVRSFSACTIDLDFLPLRHIPGVEHVSRRVAISAILGTTLLY